MNWSEHIPLMTLLGVVALGATVIAQHRSLEKAFKHLMDVTIPRIHARQDEEKEWRIRIDERLKEQDRERRRRIQTHAHGTRVPPEDETPP